MTATQFFLFLMEVPKYSKCEKGELKVKRTQLCCNCLVSPAETCVHCG